MILGTGIAIFLYTRAIEAQKEIMQKEGKGIAINDNDDEEIIYRNPIGLTILLALILMLFFFNSGQLLFITILALLFVVFIVYCNETVTISSKGVKYSTFFKKIECNWNDIFRMEVVTHKSRSEQTGLVVSSTTEYIIITSKGDFYLEESSWGWSALILREIFDDMIKPHAQDAEIIQREEESTLHDTGGK